MRFKKFLEDVSRIKWVVGSLGSNGILLKSRGLTLKLDYLNTDELVTAFQLNDESEVKATDGKQYRFVPAEDGYMVYPMSDTSEGLHLTKDDVAQIMSIASDNTEPQA